MSHPENPSSEGERTTGVRFESWCDDCEATIETDSAEEVNAFNRVHDHLAKAPNVPVDEAARVAAYGKVIWETSRADEGTISATGANIVARAVMAVADAEKVELRETVARINRRAQTAEAAIHELTDGTGRGKSRAVAAEMWARCQSTHERGCARAESAERARDEALAEVERLTAMLNDSITTAERANENSDAWEFAAKQHEAEVTELRDRLAKVKALADELETNWSTSWPSAFKCLRAALAVPVTGDPEDGTTQRPGCTCGGISACLVCQEADAGLGSAYAPDLSADFAERGDWHKPIEDASPAVEEDDPCLRAGRHVCGPASGAASPTEQATEGGA